MARPYRRLREQLEEQRLRRVRTDRLYGPMVDRVLRLVRLPTLHSGFRLRLLSTVLEGRFMSRRYFYHLYAWRGRWTWGIGFDHDGVGIYLGPLSAWFIWSGR